MLYRSALLSTCLFLPVKHLNNVVSVPRESRFTLTSGELENVKEQCDVKTFSLLSTVALLLGDGKEWTPFRERLWTRASQSVRSS